MASKGPEITDVTGILVNADLQLADFLIVAPVVIPILFSALLLMLRTRPATQGRIAIIASCAFFSFAADTIFMALVICMVDPTDAILFLISFKFAIFLSYY